MKFGKSRFSTDFWQFLTWLRVAALFGAPWEHVWGPLGSTWRLPRGSGEGLVVSRGVAWRDLVRVLGPPKTRELAGRADNQGACCSQVGEGKSSWGVPP